MRAAVLVCLAACGRISFDPGGDGGLAGDADVGSRDRCPAAPRPTGAPTQRVGNGTAASCDAAALAAALSTGGWIGFDCGAAMHTIVVTTELLITQDTILDGGGRITLDGGGASRIVNVAAGVTSQIVVLDMALVNGLTMDYGAAMLIQSGEVTIIGSTLTGHRGPVTGGLLGGGAISAPPINGTLAIYDSVLRDNWSANGGAINIWNDLTIVESTLTENRATGTGGDTANGGLGGAIQNTGRGALTMCGVTIANNSAGWLGGALHRVCTDGTCVDEITRSNLVDNISERAGAVYHQGAALTLSQTTVANNIANNDVGGFWTLTSPMFVAENVTIANNKSGVGLGAGLSVGATTGSISFSTITNNECLGAGCAAAAIAATSAISLRATVIANNTIDAIGAPISCNAQMMESSDNFQWPVVRPGGGTDDPAALCTANIRVTDPLLDPALVERVGPHGRYRVATPTSGSPALAITSACPAEDQLGRTRPAPCSAGAVEP
jgi:hypothetical protein